MADTNRNDGTGMEHHELDAATNSNYNSRCPTTNERRTRSQLNVPDSAILRLPCLRPPHKGASKAHTKARGTSSSQPHIPGTSQLSTVERGAAEGEEEMDISMDELEQKYEEEEGSGDSLVSPNGHDGDDSCRNQRTMWPTSPKKRASPDTDTMRALSSPGRERQAKRPKVESLQILGRRQEHWEYHEPLRDPNARSPLPQGYKRASSTKPIPSPRKKVSSIFPPRAQSVPLGGEDEVRTIDFTSISPSPRRSPSKGAVEIRRAPSVPLPNGERIDVEDTVALLQFTNPTHITTPRANAMFRYTVNFATPHGFTPPPVFPLSPLTPLPPSPPTEYLPEMHDLLHKKANAKLLALSDNKEKDTLGSLVNSSMADTTRVVYQSVAHVPSRSSPAAFTSRQASVVPGSSAESRLAGSPLTSSKSMEPMPLPAAPQRKDDLKWVATMTGSSGQPKDASSNNSDDAGRTSTSASADLSSGPNSRLDSNVMPVSRPSIIGAMRPRRGPSVQQGSKRVTRSVSMKEQRVKDEHAEFEDTTAEVPVAITNTVAGPSSTVTSKSRPLKSTGAAIAESKPSLTARRSTSVSKLPPDFSKLKQTSLAGFVKAKSSTIGGIITTGGSAASTLAGGPSRVAPSFSPSKIPLPASPLKRPSMLQPGSTKPFLFSLTSTGTRGTGTSHGTPGHSLTTLSHALDKLAAPPPSRPNTSMGFVRADGTSEEDGKGKRKAKDDASLPMAPTARGSGTTFARPTASSLKRAATVTGFSLAAARMRGRSGAAVGGPGRGRGTGAIFGRAGDRASKKTSLPPVIGSPVKESRGTADLDRDSDLGAGKHKLRLNLDSAKDGGGVTVEEDVFMSQDIVAGDGSEQDTVMQDVSAELLKAEGGSALKPPMTANASSGVKIDLMSSPISADKGRQRAAPSSTLNPASSALHALSESLSSLPQTPTPPKPRAVGTRTGLRSSSAAAGKESPALSGSGIAGPSGDSEVHGSGGGGGGEPSSGTVNGSGGVKKSTLKILKRCAIFVDVRTEQGDDAGSLFVDMLKGLGAKIMSRLGSRCTHIVYKNGHPHTLTRYRMLDDPKPVVVGIAWVVECVEKRAKVDEARFKIDVDLINVANARRKRRRSFPKHLIPASPGPDHEMLIHMSSEADEADEGAGGVDGSPSQDPDLSMRSREDDLPPLERARRRRSILPGGQTRLVL